MKILLLISSFNSLSQRVYCELKELNHEVRVLLSKEENLQEDINNFNPDIIFAPFFKRVFTK